MAGIDGSRGRVAATLLAVAAGASLALVFAIWVTRPEGSRAPPGRAPSSIAGILLCRWPFAVAGYRTERDGRVVFPLTHPERPGLGEPPARCFPSFGHARRAGYRVARPPAGVRLVRGVYLVPRAGDLAETCRSAEPRLSFSAPCPGLVPSGIAWGCEPCIDADSFVLEGEADAPEGYRGKYGDNAIHLVVAASTERDRARVTCIRGRAEGELRVRGRHVRVERCPDGSSLHSGHLLGRWERSGVQYAVSLHGSDPRNRPLLRVLVAAVASVAEGRSAQGRHSHHGSATSP